MDLRRVDLNLLVVLDVLLAERNVTRAAKRLNMSQPATSTALARLRKQFDDPLLVKNGRTLRLTPRAESLMEPLRSTLNTLERTVLGSPTFDPSIDTRAFTVMAGEHAETLMLRRLMRGGAAANVRFDIRPVSRAGLDAFHRFDYDLAVLPEHLLAAPEFANCERRILLSERLVGAVWAGHPYSGPELTREVMTRYPLLTYSHYADDTNLGRALLRAGIVPRAAATTASIAVLPYALENTRFVTLMPERMARHLSDLASLRILEPAFPLPRLRELAVWHAERESDPGHAWLLDQLEPIVQVEHTVIADAV